MSTIPDSVLAEIADGQSTGGLPKSLARAIFNRVRLLRAVRSVEDISVFAPYVTLPAGRMAVLVDGKWAISFRWVPGLGLDDLKLEKQGKSWFVNVDNSSRLRRRAKS